MKKIKNHRFYIISNILFKEEMFANRLRMSIENSEIVCASGRREKN